MQGERPAISEEEVCEVLEEPDHDDGRSARKRVGRRTVIVRYAADEDRIFVRSVSATRRRLQT